MADPKERPILFSGPMVRAILAGQKTVTRRLVRWRVQGFGGGLTEPTDHPGAPTYEPRGGHTVVHTHPDGTVCGMPVLRTPAMPGDTLWVRETWQTLEIDGAKLCAYRASCPSDMFDFYGPHGVRAIEVHRWRPGIHMPRWASRIILRVTDVRVERLHAIDAADAMREGVMVVESESVLPARLRFVKLWEMINGKRAPWSSNPWVWRVGFKQVTP